ncbi:MAG: hypothetical protein ABMA13_11895 [Chthoniobacteraceae bacterium]
MLALGVAKSGFAEVPPVIKSLIEQLLADVQAEMKSADAKRGADERWRRLFTLMKIEQALDGSGVDLPQLLGEFEGQAGSEKLQQLSRELAVKVTDELAARKKAEEAEIAGLLDTEMKSVLDAKSAADLDVLLAKLERFPHSLDTPYGPARTTGQRLNRAITFIRKWQDYLVARQAGDSAFSRVHIIGLFDSAYEQVVPRSKLLQVTFPQLDLAKNSVGWSNETEPTVGLIAAGVKKLDQLSMAVRLLDQIQPKTPYESKLSSDLRSLENAYAQARSGRFASLRLPKLFSSSEEITRLHEAVLSFALARALGLDESTHPVKPGEDAAAYFRRKLAEAQQKRDWSLVGRIVSTSISSTAEATNVSASDAAVLTQFLAGLNQEKAKQFSLAVATFQAVLMSGSSIVPPEAIGEHIERIRAEHPADYERGVQIALASQFASAPNPLPPSAK